MDDSAAPREASSGNGGHTEGGSNTELAALRRILVGPEQHRLEELATELRDRHVTAADLAEHLPEAIVQRAQRDRQLGRALAPTVETALRESIRRNPREIATAIFPILGPAIRKAIAETMSALVRSINSAVEHSLSPRGIKWRIESWRTGVPYPQVVIKHALVYRVEQAFLIHAETGLLLSHATAPGLQVPDADLISGMLTAIQDFVRDSFRPGEGATLSTFTVGAHTVQVEAGPLALLALVIKGEAPDALRRKQQDVLEHIHLQYAGVLSDFSGDSTPFQAVHEDLEECLETVVDTGDQRRGRTLWMRWAIPVALVVVAGLVVMWRANARFERAVDALDREPGLVVLNAQHGWRSWEISGLRDPQARTPQAVLAGLGVVPRALSGRWESYLALDSAVVVARARKAMRFPDGTALALRGDTLIVSGDVPLSSLRQLNQDMMPAGVGSVSLMETRVVLPPSLDSIRESLVSDRVLFSPGQSVVGATGRAGILAAAERFRTLDDSVTASTGAITLTLNGRTDPTGSSETNQSLAQWRVDHVAAIFALAGVRTQRIRSEALATSRPLTASDSAAQARINRSVSFEIEVLARPRASGERR